MKIKKMKHVALMLVSVMLLGMFAGCGQSFDASGYTKALMDNSYKNDSTDFVKLKIGTAEEAAELYEQGIDSEVSMMLTSSGATVSEELEQEYREVFKKVLSKAKYTVGEAQKKDDKSYEVTVTYQQMKVFEPAMQEYMAKIEELSTQYTEETLPSDEELYDILFTALKDAINNAVDGAEYGEEETMTIRIELNNNVYSPNESDFQELETNLFDIESALNSLG